MHLITTHTQADFDALASMIAVKKLYPEAILAFSGTQEGNVKDYLYSGILADYYFYSPKDIDTNSVSTLSIVDTRSSSRIGSFSRCLGNENIRIHLYDHHPQANGDLTGDQEFIENYGATTTLLTQLLQQQKFSLTPAEATTLALGIYEDTGSMLHLTTTTADLNAAVWLFEQGARLDIINRYLRRELTRTQLEILYELLNTAQNYTIQDVPLTLLTWSGDEYIDDFPRIIRRFMAMEHLSAVFALISMAGNIYLIALSETAEINAGKIARDFGGNGAISAGSATIRDITLIQAQEKLIHHLHHHIRPVSMASEMMSSPAITIPQNSSITEAHRILSRYNITAAPVVENEEIIGIISRQIIERANHHQLAHRPVSDYMTSEFVTLSPKASLADIQEIIIDNHQRIIPIIGEKKNTLKGIITRTDLLRKLVNAPSHNPQKRDEKTRSKIFSQHDNLSEVIAHSLGKDMILLLRLIGELAVEKGYTAYAVGGFVRDLLLGRPNFDLDVVVEGDGIRFARHLATHTGGRYSPHERFKTAVVMLPEELSKKLGGDGDIFKVDVATARLEYYDSPAAMPTVELSSIKLDLYRRDFTINAMAIQLIPERFGQLIDYFQSQRDLQKRTIKTLHNLSFVEDPSRIFRAIRFEKRMDFQISPHTRRLIKNAVEMNLFGKGNDPRFLAELKILLQEPNPLPGLERLGQFGLYQFLWPDLQPHLRIDRRYRHIMIQAQQVLTWHKMLYPKEKCKNWRVYLLTIMSRSQEEILENFCTRFMEKERNREILLSHKKTAQTAMQLLMNNSRLSNSEIATILEEVELECLLYMLAIARKKHIRQAISLYITSLRHTAPLLTGKDLIAMGYKPGPVFTEIFDVLRTVKLDGEVQKKEEEEAVVRSHFPLPST